MGATHALLALPTLPCDKDPAISQGDKASHGPVTATDPCLEACSLPRSRGRRVPSPSCRARWPDHVCVPRAGPWLRSTRPDRSRTTPSAPPGPGAAFLCRPQRWSGRAGPLLSVLCPTAEAHAAGPVHPWPPSPSRGQRPAPSAQGLLHHCKAFVSGMDYSGTRPVYSAPPLSWGTGRVRRTDAVTLEPSGGVDAPSSAPEARAPLPPSQSRPPRPVSRAALWARGWGGPRTPRGVGFHTAGGVSAATSPQRRGQRAGPPGGQALASSLCCRVFITLIYHRP